MTRARLPPFPDPTAAPQDGPLLVARWEAVLSRAPGLRPWLEQMIARRRVLLHEAARGSIEEALWLELETWVREFEALPQFAVSAIATTLEEPEHRAPPLAHDAAPQQPTPERTFSDQQALFTDPAFALAFHCVEETIRPALPADPPDWVWFALLHASAPQQPLLTPAVAVGLVLRLLGGGFSKLPAPARNAALRLFRATAGDLRAVSRIQQLCAALPGEWNVAPEPFVRSAATLRDAFDEACALCARLAAAARPTQAGGLSVITVDRSLPATPEEVARVSETARKFNTMPGLRRLLSLL